MKISVVQPETLWENKTGNLLNLTGILSSLRYQTDVVILPEMFSTGFSMNTEFAEDFHGDTYEWMKDMAEQGGFAVCGSFIAKENGSFFNRFAFISSDDEYYYDKRHLFSIGDENLHYSKGKSRMVFSFRGVRISPYICYDLRFPVWSRNRDDYDLSLYVASWPESRANVWNTLLRARAIENQCYVAGANRIGIDGNGIRHNGLSQIINPRGELIKLAGENEECAITAEISIPELYEFRRKFNVMRDADDFEIRI
jgi:predicted amidohydrolase